MLKNHWQKANRTLIGVLAGGVSMMSWGYVAYNFLGQGGPQRPYSTAPAKVDIKTPLAVDDFKRQVADFSRQNLTVVVLRKAACTVCPRLSDAFEKIHRDWKVPFTVYEVDGEQNPEIARALRQSNPAAQTGLHIFYKGKKVHELKETVFEPFYLQDYLDQVKDMADGKVSATDPYQDPDELSP